MSSPESPFAASASWRLAGLSAIFVFDIARISRGEGDLLEPLILTAVLQANQGALPGDPDLQLEYGEAGAALPDEDRRPISINAIARSLGLPFETVRRRAQALVGRGLCVTSPGGILVPRAVVTSPAYLAVLHRRAARVAQLHDELVSAGLQPAVPGLSAFVDDRPRAVDRILADYMLRACDALLELTGDAMDGMALLGLGATNLKDPRAAQAHSWASYAEAAAPCSAGALATALGMPRETVRRRLIGLERRGLCRRVRRGWIAGAPDGHPLLGGLAERNAQNLRRMFAALIDLSRRAVPPGLKRAT